MRLARGAGVRGLAGIRPRSTVPGAPDLALVRPLLGWCRSELQAICSDAGLTPADDPSNDDSQFERVRMRRAIAGADWIDPQALARSASHLAAADDALEWAVDEEWRARVDEEAGRILYRPSDAPTEIRRRVAARAVRELGTEGPVDELRGRELDRLVAELQGGRPATLRGVRCSGGGEWVFVRAPARKSA